MSGDILPGCIWLFILRSEKLADHKIASLFYAFWRPQVKRQRYFIFQECGICCTGSIWLIELKGELVRFFNPNVKVFFVNKMSTL